MILGLRPICLIIVLNFVNSFQVLNQHFTPALFRKIQQGHLHQQIKMSTSDRNLGELSVNVGPTGNVPGRVEVYSTLGCKFCRMAKFKLDELGVTYHNVDITMPADAVVDVKRQQKRVEDARERTVPQIYVGEEYIGGCDKLMIEIDNGIFFDRLSRHDIVASVSDSAATTPILHSRTSSSVKMMEKIDELPDKIKREGVLNSVRNEIQSGVESPTECKESSPVKRLAPLELSSALQLQALRLTDKFASMDGSRVDYKKMKISTEFEDYILLSESLQLCTLDELSNLSAQKRLSFFANLYNAMIIHATCILGTPSTPQGRSRLFNGESGAVYRIGGQTFSPDDIEHGILRGNSPHPSQPDTATSYLPVWDVRSQLAIPYLDPRIHFILNCGAQSCPPIRILGEDPEVALASSSAAYLEGEVVKRIEEESGLEKVFIPKLSLWYSNDFGKDMKSKISKLLLISAKNGRSHTVLTELIGKYKDASESYQGEELEAAYGLIDDTVRYNTYSWASNDIN